MCWRSPKLVKFPWISSLNTLRILSGCAVLLTLGVIVLGALTRLLDAGLGCPDWPRCYGQWIPTATAKIASLSLAWIEMIHRYAVGLLSFLILIILSVLGMRKKYWQQRNIVIAGCLLI